MTKNFQGPGTWSLLLTRNKNGSMTHFFILGNDPPFFKGQRETPGSCLHPRQRRVVRLDVEALRDPGAGAEGLRNDACMA